MNSMITVGDTDEEVIDLDSSQDAIVDTDNDQSECSIDKNSLSNNATNWTDISANVEYNQNTLESRNCDNAGASKPLFKVMFRDESISRQYSKQIKEFVEKLISSKIKSQENDDGLTLEIWDDTNFASQSGELTTESNDNQDIICDTLFTVDTQPKLKNEFDVPEYGKKYENAFQNSKEEPHLNLKDDSASKVMCFNCLENHTLKSSPKVYNLANIKKNWKNFQMKGNSKTLRYHLNDDQKFGHMIPGKISSKLRKALGLKDNELPQHIYRMRTLGYPPGWLEEARLQHSGLSLFNSDGVAEIDPDDEPGSIFEYGDKDQYDIKKIFDFPGFNVPPPPGIHDDYSHYWVTKLQADNSKKTMLRLLQGKQADEGYKRKKLKVLNTPGQNDPAPEPSKMELEDVQECIVESIPVNGYFVPPLPRKSAIKPPEPPLPSTQVASEKSDSRPKELQFSESPSYEILQENIASPSSRTNSPSLSDLENMKKQLLVELQESNSQSNSDVLLKNNSLNSTPKTDMGPPSSEVTPESNRFRRTTANTSHGSVKSVDFGTPVLESTSPYSKLPTSDKFSRNICDVINFENLPDSTGKYEQMSKVLQKVRNTLSKLQQE